MHAGVQVLRRCIWSRQNDMSGTGGTGRPNLGVCQEQKLKFQDQRQAEFEGVKE